MFDLINEMSELVYVVDIDTYDLLFINRSGKLMFGLDDISGMKCYQAIQGRSRPCEYCTNRYLKQDQFYTWELTNPRLRRHYLLKDKLIEWEGKKARVEIAFDTTDGEIEKWNLKNSLAAENLVTECARSLFTNESNGNRVDEVLRMVGSFLESGRAYIFEIHDECMSNTYEWCAPGVEAVIPNLQNMPAAIIDRWRSAFGQRKCVLIEDIEAIREESPLEYETLRAQGIHSLIAAPIYSNNILTGFIGVNNYSTHKLANAPAILGSIGYFIGAMFQNVRSLQLLERLSYYDTLTGLGNRNKFNMDTEHFSVSSERPAGIVRLDINGMKRINDEQGHSWGDRTLKGVAEKIKSVFPAECAYRIGGDEFVVIHGGAEEDVFRVQVRELQALLEAEKGYSVSVGGYWSNDTMDMRKILFQADEQMYQDKKKFYHGKALSGRYRHGRDDILDMTQPGSLKRMLDKGQFQIYYQPKMSSDSHTLIGAEALARCEISPGTMVKPDLFIPVLEESRLISALDFHVFCKVSEQIDAWMKAGKTVSPISVNFSRYTLSERNFLIKLQDAWSEYRVPKQLLEIEVTETVEEDDSYNFIELIKEIKKMGFLISIDDFGIKNANLSLFTSMDFDILKIDRSLIGNLTQNEKAQAVLASISDICRKMGIKMIVEGVETDEQLTILRKLGCDGIQGFLFSRPLPLTDFEGRYMN